jgi:Uma2 family endonuclease
MPPLAAPLLVAHCDWSTHPAKRWMAVGWVEADGRASADAPEPVADAATLLDRLGDRAGGATVLAGFDFPIGVPQAYAEQAGIRRFRDLLARLAAGELPLLLEPAERPEDIAVDRPFYPARPGGTSTRQLLDGLGAPDMTALLRRCERRTPTRRAGASLFWLVGGAQVGKAAIAGWRSVLLPAIAGPAEVGLWPHDGPLEHLLAHRDVVLAETYPTEFAAHLPAPVGPAGKRERAGRAPACRALEARTAALGIALTEAAAAELAADFGDDRTGEDRFDAFLGLVGMLGVVSGRRGAGPPASVAEPVVAAEGWILGQLDDGGAAASERSVHRRERPIPAGRTLGSYGPRDGRDAVAAPLETGLTVADLERFEADDGRRVELIAGAVYVSPMANLRHQWVVARLAAIFMRYVEAHGGATFAGANVTWSEESLVIPDQVLVSAATLARVTSPLALDVPPDLVVEVSSGSTRRYDLVVKRPHYARLGVAEHWFVDLDADRIEVSRLTGDAYAPPQLHGAGEVIAPPGLPGLQVAVDEVLAGYPGA